MLARPVDPGKSGVWPDGSIPDGFEAQHEQIWQNTLAILADAGMGSEDIGRLNVYRRVLSTTALPISYSDGGLALDLDLHAWIDQPPHLHQRRGRQVVAEVRDAARIDLRPLRDVGHEHLNLDDVLGSGAGRLQALVHCGDGNVEMGDDIGGNAAVVRLTDDASDRNVGARASDVAVVANGCWDIGNDSVAESFRQ